MTAPIWQNEKRKLADLVPWSRNPRSINQSEAARLSASLQEFNQTEMILIGPENQVYNGHQRLSVWARTFGRDLEVEVRVSDRPLTEKEREKLTIYLHRGTVGSWDMEMLANEFDTDELLEWGFEKAELDLGGFDLPSDGSLLSLVNVTIEDPRHEVRHGEVYAVGLHILACASVLKDWALWTPYLKPDCLLATYPGAFLTMTRKADETPLVMIQPDPYICGHILDRYEDIHGSTSIRRLDEE